MLPVVTGPIIEWREVHGFPGYEINQLGFVRRSPDSRITHETWPGKQIPRHEIDGSVKVRLYRSGRLYVKDVDRVVLLTFVGEPPHAASWPVHLDSNWRNVRLENLRWSTKAEGIKYAKLAPSDIEEIRAARSCSHNRPTLKQLAERYDISVRHVIRIVKNQAWK